MFKLPFKINFNKKSKTDTFLTIDIGSSTVKTLAFYNDSESRLKVIGLGKEFLPEGAVRAGYITDLKSVIEAVDETIYQALANTEHRITDAIIGISENLCYSQVTTGRLNRTTPGELVTEKELDNLKYKIIDAAYNTALDDFVYKTGDLSTELIHISSIPAHTKLDSKIVDDPTDLPGAKVELAIYNAYSPEYHTKQLQKIADTLKLSVLAMVPNMFSLGEALKKLTKDNELDCIILDIGGETTDVGIMFGGGLITTKSLPIGGRHYTEQLSLQSGLTWAESEKKKNQYYFGQTADTETSFIETVMTETTDLWLSGLETLFNEFNGVRTFASDIFVVGGGSLLPDIMAALESRPWTKSIPFREPPRIKRVSISELDFARDTTGKLNELDYIQALSLGLMGEY